MQGLAGQASDLGHLKAFSERLSHCLSNVTVRSFARAQQPTHELDRRMSSIQVVPYRYTRRRQICHSRIYLSTGGDLHLSRAYVAPLLRGAVAPLLRCGTTWTSTRVFVKDSHSVLGAMVRTSKTDHFFKLAPFWSPLTDLIDFGMAGKLLTSATRWCSPFVDSVSRIWISQKNHWLAVGLQRLQPLANQHRREYN